MLEDGWGDIFDGPESSQIADPNYPEPFTQYLTVLDRAGYIKKVRAASARAARRLTSPDQAVIVGMPFDLHALALRLYRRIRSGHYRDCGQTEWERMCFEATTGIDCSGFYKDTHFQASVAMPVLEEFLDSGDVARFEIGTRYFFGHRIPD